MRLAGPAKHKNNILNFRCLGSGCSGIDLHMLGFYDAWEEADRLQKQSEEEKLFYDAWKEADKLEKKQKKDKKRKRREKADDNQHARDAASLRQLAEAVAAKEEPVEETASRMHVAEAVAAKEEPVEETASRMHVAEAVAAKDESMEKNMGESDKTWDLTEKIQSLLLNKFLQDALIARQLQAQQHNDENVSIQGSQAKASAVPPPAPAQSKASAVPPPSPQQLDAKRSSEPESCPQQPVPIHPSPKAPSEPQGAPERVRGFACKEHEGRYYVPGHIVFIFYFNMFSLFFFFFVSCTKQPLHKEMFGSKREYERLVRNKNRKRGVGNQKKWNQEWETDEWWPDTQDQQTNGWWT